MAVQAEMKQGGQPGILVTEIYFRPAESDISAFERADLVFTGVDHSGMSYEVRAYLNNPQADENTPRTVEEGYGGRFIIFGHGGCYGGIGHCQIPTERPNPTDLRPVHPLTPQTKIITVTRTLNHILQSPAGELKTVTLVPISKDPIQDDRGLTESLFRFKSVELRTYR
jgi:tyrosinase